MGPVNPTRYPAAVSLPKGYAIRPATHDDAQAVGAVLLADDQPGTERSVYDEDFVRVQWATPGFEPASDAWVVLGPQGSVVAAANAIPEGETQLKSWGVVHPDHRGLGIGSTLLDRLRARVAERLAGVPGATFQHSIDDVDEAARAMLLARGLTLVRSFRHMQVDLDGPRDPGPMPPGIRLRDLDPRTDLPAAHAVFVEVFEDQWGYRVIPFEEWLEHEVDTPGFDPSLWLLAADGDEIVGALNAVVVGDRGWIGELGVREAWRGRGIASAMLRRSFATFAERGLPRVTLNVDFENPTGAMALYEKVGMRPVRGYDVYEGPIA